MIFNTLMPTVLALTGCAALSLVFTWFFARLWCKPKRNSNIGAPDDHGLPSEPVNFPSKGVDLHGWLIPAAPREQPPVVIIPHGWSSNAEKMLPVAAILHEAGFSVLLYDARGHGASGDDGPITLRKFTEDLISAIDFLETRPDVDMGRLGIVGHSMGGACAIIAASVDRRIKAVVSGSAFADSSRLVREALTRMHIPSWPLAWIMNRIIERWLGTSIEDYDPGRAIRRITSPTMLIHGDSDRFISPANLDALYANANPEVTERMLVPGGRHSDAIENDRCVERLIDFLREALIVDGKSPGERGGILARN